MIGPLMRLIFPAYVISPMGLCAKKAPCKFKVIHDLSAPLEGVSVNSCIPTGEGTVKYNTIYMAIQFIQQAGPGAILAKTDIEHMYKLIPIHPDDIPELGIRWFHHWLWDATLPMGSRLGITIFETFSEALQHLAQWKQCDSMCHMLDDFLMVSTDDEVANEKLKTLLGLCDDLGIPVIEDKMEKGPCIVLLGMTLDTFKMEARLSQDKLDRCLTLVRTKQENTLQSASWIASTLHAGLLLLVCLS